MLHVDCTQLCLFGWKSLILLDLSSMLRLYVQQGLSNRVLRALQERLERAMSGNPGEETRDRTRSPVRAVHGDGTGPDGTIRVKVETLELCPMEVLTLELCPMEDLMRQQLPMMLLHGRSRD